jgi:hypothetical protein
VLVDERALSEIVGEEVIMLRVSRPEAKQVLGAIGVEAGNPSAGLDVRRDEIVEVSGVGEPKRAADNEFGGGAEEEDGEDYKLS